MENPMLVMRNAIHNEVIRNIPESKLIIDETYPGIISITVEYDGAQYRADIWPVPAIPKQELITEL